MDTVGTVIDGNPFHQHTPTTFPGPHSHARCVATLRLHSYDCNSDQELSVVSLLRSCRIGDPIDLTEKGFFGTQACHVRAIRESSEARVPSAALKSLGCIDSSPSPSRHVPPSTPPWGQVTYQPSH